MFRNVLGLLLLTVHLAPAQVEKHARWQWQLTKQEVKAGETFEIVFQAKIEEGWYLYSNDFNENLGPQLTVITLEKNPAIQVLGKPLAIGQKRKYDDIWGGEISYFKQHAEFRIKIKALAAIEQLSGKIEGQVCTEIDGKCVLMEEDFALPGPKVLIDKKTVLSGKQEIIKKDSLSAEGKQDTATTVSIDPPTVKKTIYRDIIQPETTSESALWKFMLAAFLTGLAALLTPCVFPMIPMTVTFFLKGSATRKQAITKAFFYGFSIIAIYTLTGTVVAKLAGPEAANFLSTHWLPNVFFFIVFILFGLSFLGLFDIVLPSSLVNSVDKRADKGGYIGIFFMAFTLVLVSFSCTGPIVGSILVESAGGQLIKPIAGMFAFSLAFAAPFTLFAIFPEWLQNLPKSGGWLNSVKVVLGFLELALAFKFLSLADQAYHWGLLDREVQIAIWMSVFFVLGLYLLGKVRLPHDSATETVGVPRVILSMASFAFVVYLLPGMFGAPLKALSGYLPPLSTHDFVLSQSGNAHSEPAEYANLCEPPLFGGKTEIPRTVHFPHGLKGYYELDQALNCAKKLGKPVFVDFTGHGCVNCREMEANVWSNPGVLKILKEDYVIAGLYVDDKTELPESKWYSSTYDGKVKKSIGKQNADLQITRFKNNAQPYYVLLDPEGNLLAQPKGYDSDPAHFISFLEEGKRAIAAIK